MGQDNPALPGANAVDIDRHMRGDTGSGSTLTLGDEEVKSRDPEGFRSIDSIFEQWAKEKWQPKPGFITLREAKQRWEGTGVDTPLAELLVEVPCVGVHMHAPLVDLPPNFALDDRRWEVNPDESWCREKMRSKSMQSRFQVAVDEQTFMAHLHAVSNTPAFEPSEAHFDPGPQPVQSLPHFIRPAAAPREVTLRCSVCETPGAPETMLLMGVLRGEPRHLCGECQKHAVAQILP